MAIRIRSRRGLERPLVEWAALVLGAILLLLSPLVGAIPGPGGILVAGIGLALILKSSSWAKRRYVQFKRWKPRAGQWSDWALQRRSAKRRHARRKVEQASASN